MGWPPLIATSLWFPLLVVHLCHSKTNEERKCVFYFISNGKGNTTIQLKTQVNNILV